MFYCKTLDSAQPLATFCRLNVVEKGLKLNIVITLEHGGCTA